MHYLDGTRKTLLLRNEDISLILAALHSRVIANKWNITPVMRLKKLTIYRRNIPT